MLSKPKLLALAITAAVAGCAIAFVAQAKPDPVKWDIEITQGNQTWYTNEFSNHGTCIEFFDWRGRHTLVCGSYGAHGRTTPKPEVKANET